MNAQLLNVCFSNRALLSSSVCPAFVVITVWFTLLYVVGLAIALAATSIGRVGLESLALGRAETSALGHELPIQQGIRSGSS